MYFELKQILNVKLKLAREENSFDSPERNRGYRNSHDFSLLKNFISSFFFSKELSPITETTFR